MPDSYRQFSGIDSDTQALTLKRLRRLSHILDKVVAVPGTPIRIGLDPLIGFIPIGGDVLGIILASYIVIEAARLGVPKAILSKMVLNVIIDGLVGTVPVMGDLFDFVWTANEYNIKLLEEHLQLPLRRKL
ncbi:DUF4112 domain-containing protein [Nodularia sphaerocarpa]|uniref:DUF4112 domain-containing protein n=2 Tax=Nodularia sphaerocarpa TaxID=137816 RepID=UPI001EFB0CC9|nr:DUF4112 domain-containing protein [Nodularia sphaerocarpa]MDB9375109.1 DUF4112 domain-containing protein [Nodularia sphaerocarpa CS-585]ULP73489.1 hypothetical protein BDGGKGIB_03143 [Nodularia sphaerocarpa UHCC 0038]